MSQIELVYQQYLDGESLTNTEVSIRSLVPTKAVSTHVSRLCERGALRANGMKKDNQGIMRRAFRLDDDGVFKPSPAGRPSPNLAGESTVDHAKRTQPNSIFDFGSRRMRKLAFKRGAK